MKFTCTKYGWNAKMCVHFIDVFMGGIFWVTLYVVKIADYKWTKANFGLSNHPSRNRFVLSRYQRPLRLHENKALKLARIYIYTYIHIHTYIYFIYILFYIYIFIFFCHHHHMECLPFSDLRIFSFSIPPCEWLTSTPFLLLVYYIYIYI